MSNNAYWEMKDAHREELDAFPLKFAFNREQFEQGMAELGLKPTDTDKIYGIGGGGFYRKEDSAALWGMFERHEKEIGAAICADETGDGFIFDMFRSELANHEFSYTQDVTDALQALGMTIDQIDADPRLRHGLSKAMAFEMDAALEMAATQEDPLELPAEPSEKDYLVCDYIGCDNWDRPVYQIEGFEGYFKDTNCGQGVCTPALHWASPQKSFEGEPDYPFKANKELRFLSSDGLTLPMNAKEHNSQLKEAGLRPFEELIDQAKDGAAKKNAIQPDKSEKTMPDKAR